MKRLMALFAVLALLVQAAQVEARGCRGGRCGSGGHVSYGCGSGGCGSTASYHTGTAFYGQQQYGTAFYGQQPTYYGGLQPTTEITPVLQQQQDALTTSDGTILIRIGTTGNGQPLYTIQPRSTRP